MGGDGVSLDGTNASLRLHTEGMLDASGLLAVKDLISASKDLISASRLVSARGTITRWSSLFIDSLVCSLILL